MKHLLIILGALFYITAASQNSLTDKTNQVSDEFQQMRQNDKRYLDSLVSVYESNANVNRLEIALEILRVCPGEDNMTYIPIVEDQIKNYEDTTSNQRQLNIYKAELELFKGAHYYLVENDRELTLLHYKKEHDLRVKAKDTIRLGDYYMRLSNFYQEDGRYLEMLDLLKTGLSNFNKWGYLKGEGKLAYQLSLFYSELGDKEIANKYIQRAQNVEFKIGDSTRITRGLYLIGKFHLTNNDVDSAKQYFDRCIDRATKLEDYRNLIQSSFEIGKIHAQKGDIDLAIEKQLKVYDQAVEHKEYQLFYHASMELARCYRLKKEYDKALVIYNRMLDMLLKFDLQQPIIQVNTVMAEFYLETNQTSKAKEKIDKVLSTQYFQAYAPPTMKITAMNIAYKIDSATLNYASSLEHYKMLKHYSEIVKSEDLILQEAKNSYAEDLLRQEEKSKVAQQIKDAEIARQNAVLETKEHQQYILYGGLGIALLFGGFIFNRFRVTSKQKGIIEEQKQQVDKAYDELEEKNTEILDSINYAKRIQTAILPPNKLVKAYLKESCILYKPKDIVAGDFYWLEPTKDSILFAAADCTGHGVPGAMVSVVCNNGLNRSVREYGLTDPGQILDKTREIVISEFEKSEEEVKDGMDIALCSLQGNTLKYAGAHNPLWIIRKDAQEVEEIKANKQPIGKFDEPLPYTTHTVELNEGDSFYIFSDGYADQFGGEKGKKLKAKNFKSLLLSIQNETMERQRELIDEAFATWKGNYEQLDDVCLIGVSV